MRVSQLLSFFNEVSVQLNNLSENEKALAFVVVVAVLCMAVFLIYKFLVITRGVLSYIFCGHTTEEVRKVFRERQSGNAGVNEEVLERMEDISGRLKSASKKLENAVSISEEASEASIKASKRFNRATKGLNRISKRLEKALKKQKKKDKSLGRVPEKPADSSKD